MAEGEASEEPEDGGEIYYEEPDLSGGIQGVDYRIVYGTEDKEAAQES